jgi:hypothetical protein
MPEGCCEGETEGPTVCVDEGDTVGLGEGDDEEVGRGVAECVGVGVGVIVLVDDGDQLAVAVLDLSITIAFEEEELPEASPPHPVKMY